MTIKLSNSEKLFSKNELPVLKDFIIFLQKQLPLKKDVKINFLDKRVGKMTTGSRKTGNYIKILTKNRLFIDILRTLSHEWVHEYDHQVLGLKEKAKIPDIGGVHENMANILSGIFIKLFQKENPKYSKILYGE